jgi:hypothetical protein
MLLRGFQERLHTVAELKAAPGDLVFTVLFFCVLAGLLFADAYPGFRNA